MQCRRLGASGLLVSPIALGTMTFGEPVNETESVALVHAALDMGVNFIDVANSYEGYRRSIGTTGAGQKRFSEGLFTIGESGRFW